MKYLLNYAHRQCCNSQIEQTKTAFSIGGFDYVFQDSFEDLDKEFYIKNKSILDQLKGAGYWLWKPHLLLKIIKSLEVSDFLFYLDAGACFTGKIDPLEKICREKTKGQLFFHLQEGPFNIKKNIESNQTKRDTYILMDCDNEDYWYNNYPIHGGMNGWIKNDFTLSFLEEWLYYCQNENIITDKPSTLGSNLPGFSTHRHDQSILSILRKKYNLPSFTDPSQCGNDYREKQGNLFPQIINHHRNRS
jgi:hypothetical protein